MVSALTRCELVFAHRFIYRGEVSLEDLEGRAVQSVLRSQLRCAISDISHVILISY